ncbi:hypothetical protein BGZ63DRAFT_446549 [Mariannaea sp. PMI_226]|nr:hypothetical protein BGZ63DRAFT_446549 [Mariannaea sp. PMI_226]
MTPKASRKNSLVSMSSELAKWCPLRKLRYTLAFDDPHMPPGRLHHATFVETKPSDGSGYKYNVIGDVSARQGMTYEISTVQEQWNAVLGSLSTSPQQQAPNPKNKGQVEPFKEKLGDYQYNFYEPGEERTPLWKCTEWIEWYAIPALQKNALIQNSIVEGEASSSS